jgi:hypothetical protein
MFTKEIFCASLAPPVPSTEEFHGFRDLCAKSTPALGCHFQVRLILGYFPVTNGILQLTCGEERFLARRLESDDFQFSPELELEAARAELNRGHQLNCLLRTLVDKYGVTVPELSGMCCNLFCIYGTIEGTGYTTPELFIATLSEHGNVLGHLVCQPKPVIPLREIVQPGLEILYAMSHFSYAQSKGTQIFVNFKGPCQINTLTRNFRLSWVQLP